MMNNPRSQWEKIATIGDLVDKAKSPIFGRTALMKCLYFLRAVRSVPLEYHFRLYTYGPFDPDVLDDVSYAASLHVVKSRVVSYSSGYGYQFEPGPSLDDARQRGAAFLSRHEDDITWVAVNFGQRSATDLEMLSTIVYVDRSCGARGLRMSLVDVIRKVWDVKPRLNQDQIHHGVAELKGEGLLRYVD